jgi:hypothetical protein
MAAPTNREAPPSRDSARRGVVTTNELRCVSREKIGGGCTASMRDKHRRKRHGKADCSRARAGLNLRNGHSATTGGECVCTEGADLCLPCGMGPCAE